ncbi:hypothetical protein Syun_014717 [Stephania yunnanensis]|uniref:Interferon-related developmental regulator 1 n=1 Tax=Stephania yunnanensis TaxID=152371 RepID=A0AAP0JK22_9MAGN
MGRRKNQQKNAAALFDSDDDESLSTSSEAMSETSLAPEPEEAYGGNASLDSCLDALYEKRGTTREKALSLLIDGFRNKLQHQFVANKYVTLLHQFLNSMKKGSAKEISLASNAIGLLAITVGAEDNAAREIMDETMTSLLQVLKSGTDPSKISYILECLAIVTFIGSNSSEETEKAMQIIWQFVRPKLGPNVGPTKPSLAVMTAALSAWSFLLTTMDGWKINSKTWQESISYLSSILDKDDRSMRIAAGEAIAVIFEVGSLEKFCSEPKDSTDKVRNGAMHIQGLRAKILNQVRDLAVEAGGKGSAKKDLNSQKTLFREVLEFLEDGYYPDTTMKFAGDALVISSWSRLIQVNFLKRFLGGGFVKHMLENELLQDVFDFTPKRKSEGVSESSRLDKGIHYVYVPKVRKEGSCQRFYKSPNSALNKARTQILNKKRTMSQGKNTGHYAVSAGDEE